MADHSTVARPYAKAIFEVAHSTGALDGWSSALAAAAAVTSDEAASRYLARPGLTPTERADFVAGMCQGVAGAELLSGGAGANLLKLLSENDRLMALPEISARFDRLKVRAESKIKATLIAASEVDAAQAAHVAQALERKLGRKVDLELEIDPALLGGAIVRAEDMVIDGSVRSRLQRLADTLID
jgi:F-type H+-transporting ATPase subunit delta